MQDRFNSQKINELRDINHEIKAWLDQLDVDRVNPDDRDELTKNPALQTLLQKEIYRYPLAHRIECRLVLELAHHSFRQ